MLKNYATLILMLALGTAGFSQKVRIEGVVKDTAGVGLEMANVIALSAADTSMLSYAFTDPGGRYRITVNESGNYFLRISYLGFQQVEIPIQVKEGEDRIVRNVSLRAVSTELQEAEVVEDIPIVISGDTIIYKADAFTTGRERKLEDVLSQLPGFEVDDNGEVKVQGKKVDKVMVEGRDFFDGDTKLATKNIPANAVDKVQVLRDYNEITPMQGLGNSDRMALNIKLKDGKKNIVFGDISAEGGLDERYKLHPNIFYYNPKVSINFIGDLNNIGEPAFTQQDYFRFSGGFSNINPRAGTRVLMGQNPGGDLGFAFGGANRVKEITSRFGAANFSFNPSKKWTVSGFFIANETQTLSSSAVERDYLNLPNTIGQQEDLATESVNQNTSGLLKFSTTYTPNKKLHIGYKLFSKITDTKEVDNLLRDFSINFMDTTFEGSNTIKTAELNRPYEVRQNLDAYWDINEKNLVSFEVQHNLNYTEPRLDINNDTLSFFTVIPAQDGSPYIFLQNKEIRSNKLDASLNHYLIFNNTNHINFTLGGSYTGQQYNSSIRERLADGDIYTFEADSLNNDVDFTLTDVFAAVHYRWKLGKLELNPGLNYHAYHIEDRQLGRTNADDRQFLLPDLLIKFNIKKSERIQLDYQMQAEFTDVNNVINGTVITSYNSLFRGNPGIQNALAHNVTLTYYNINLFNFSTLFAGGNYSRKIDDITQVTTLVGLDRINSPINVDGINENLSGFAGYEKRFGKLKLQAGATVNYSNINNQINDQENESQTFTQLYRMSLGTNFKKAPNLELGYNFVNNTYTGAGVSNTFQTHTPSLKFNAVFLKNFTFKADYTYNFYKAEGDLGSSEYDFLNASLRYLLGEKGKWEFSIRAINLLNTTIIRQDAFTDFFVSTTRYDVLPRYLLLGVKYDL